MGQPRLGGDEPLWRGAGRSSGRAGRPEPAPRPLRAASVQVFPPINPPTPTQYLPDGQQVRPGRPGRRRRWQYGNRDHTAAPAALPQAPGCWAPAAVALKSCAARASAAHTARMLRTQGRGPIRVAAPRHAAPQVVPVYSLPEDGNTITRAYTACPTYDARLLAWWVHSVAGRCHHTVLTCTQPGA